MALTGGNLTSLKSAHQRVKCRFVSFLEWEVANSTVAAGVYTFGDMLNMDPRYSWVTNSASITIDGVGSVQRGGAASTGHAWTLTDEAGGAAAGSKVDSGDETVYTAPAAGSGVDMLELTTDGNGAGAYSFISYGDQNLNIGAVTAFHADIESGGWEMTVRAYGDCSELARQEIVLLVIDAYWNGTESTFGGYSAWSDGVFVGVVDRMRTIHEDSEHTYVEVRLISPQTLFNYAESDPAFWARAGADEEVIVADLMVLDPIWDGMESINVRFNVYPFADDLAITNLKLSRGPHWDVMADIAARSFVDIYATRTADIYIRPSLDMRYKEYYGAHSAEFTFTTDLFEAIDVYSQDKTVTDDPPDPSDPSIGQVIMTAIQPDLTEIWARCPKETNFTAGKRVEVGGLICESPTTLETWACRYWDHLEPKVEADIKVFLFPVVDLYMQVELTFTPDATRVTNSGMTAIDEQDCYITSVDFVIDPGMGTWQGSVHIRSYASQIDFTDDIGENSDD